MSTTTTTELILYLEPTKSADPGSFWMQVQEFFNASQARPWSGNEALRYPAHITMVGFFNNLPDHHHRGSSAADLIQYIHQCLEKMHSCTAMTTATTSDSSSNRTVMQGLIRPSKDSLLIAIQPAPMLLDLIHSIKETFPELGLRLKKINHLSLCYWDDQLQQQQQQSIDHQTIGALLSQTAEMEQQRVQWVDEAEQLAREKIPLVCHWEERNGTCGKDMEMERREEVEQLWDMVLYSIQGRNKGDAKPYPLKELHRWTLP